MKKNLYSSNISTYPFRSYNKKKDFFKFQKNKQRNKETDE